MAVNQAEPDVLIIGAGPSGMTLGAALHRQGVRFRIIDKDDKPTNLTRAPVRWPHLFGSSALCVDCDGRALMFGEGEMPHH